ncbi:MAG: hypothetical protein ACC652_04585 [Acidimicrobiales bacterium]
MARSLLERRLIEVGAELRRNREELFVIEEQLISLVDQADQARLRALVSETPLAQREHVDANRHADLVVRRKAELHATLYELEARQDKLLDRLSTTPQ